jgi:hypothetical protein
MLGKITEVKASKDPRKKLEGVLQMAEKIASLEMCNFIESTHQFVIKYVNKVNRCFLHHCNENVDVFLTCYPKIKHKPSNAPARNDEMEDKGSKGAYT